MEYALKVKSSNRVSLVSIKRRGGEGREGKGREERGQGRCKVSMCEYRAFEAVPQL